MADVLKKKNPVGSLALTEWNGPSSDPSNLCHPRGVRPVCAVRARFRGGVVGETVRMRMRDVELVGPHWARFQDQVRAPSSLRAEVNRRPEQASKL